MALLLVQGIIALVVIASMVHQRDWSELMVNTLQAVAPGPSGKVLTDAVEQAQRAGSSNNDTALLVGLVISSIITACSLLGQVERGLNRLYGIERDRPTLRKYARAFVLSVSAGSLIVAASAAISLGHVFASSFGSDFATEIWNALRWALGLILATGGIALLFRWSPCRHQPAWSWLTYGAFVGVALWMLASIGLSVFFQNNSSFGDTYGQLAGLVALLLWAFATSVAVFYGGAVAAQLEAIRAGVPAPLDRTPAPDANTPDRGMVAPSRNREVAQADSRPPQ